MIWGGGDAYLPSSYAERQREFLPRAEVHVLPHSGHWPFADDPAEVVPGAATSDGVPAGVLTGPEDRLEVLSGEATGP